LQLGSFEKSSLFSQRMRPEENSILQRLQRVVERGGEGGHDGKNFRGIFLKNVAKIFH
jgi:hypothetical protein